MTASEFCKIAEEFATNVKTLYAKGCYGQKCTKSIIESKSKQKGLEEWYSKNDFTPYYGSGARLFDCVLFVKGILWGARPDGAQAKYKANNVPDIGCEGMYNLCTDKCKPTDAKRGYLLYMKGHVGIYLGDNRVAECCPSKKGVAITPLNYQKWTGSGKLPWVDYSTETKTEPKTETKPSLKVGEKVYLMKNCPVYGTNRLFASWVYNYSMYVRSITGDRIVVSTLKSGAVTGAVDRKYLRKV